MPEGLTFPKQSGARSASLSPWQSATLMQASFFESRARASTLAPSFLKGKGSRFARAFPLGCDDVAPYPQQRVGGYVVAAKGQTLVIHKAPEDKAETAADGKAETPVAFFQCASQIAAFDVAGGNVAVGCADGQVLQLFAAVLQTQA